MEAELELQGPCQSMLRAQDSVCNLAQKFLTKITEENSGSL